jgi:hypothetical protein
LDTGEVLSTGKDATVELEPLGDGNVEDLKSEFNQYIVLILRRKD